MFATEHALAADGSYGQTSKPIVNAEQLVRLWSPEIVASVSCLVCALALRLRGDTSGETDEDWVAIKNEWPLLLGADTLLSFHTMLRVLIFGSVAFRVQNDGVMPLGGGVALLWLFAYVTRVALTVLSDAYMMDGPLGGKLPVVCEVIAIPLLLLICRKTLRAFPCAALPKVMSAALLLAIGIGWLVLGHRFNFAENTTADSLWMVAHTCEALAAFGYLYRTILIAIGVWAGNEHISMTFAHILLPVQQALAAYYFLTAFDDWESGAVVAAGTPFHVMVGTNISSLGAYLLATALFIADASTATMGQDSERPAMQQVLV